MKESKGKIESCAIATRPDGTQITGKRQDGTPYTNYKYKIGGRYYSGFSSVEDYNLKRGDYCIVAYKEEPNKDPKKKPYKNIVNLTEAIQDEVSQEEVKEEDKKVNMVDVGEPTPQDKSKVADFKEKDADKYELGMAKNNAAIIFATIIDEPGTTAEGKIELIKKHKDYYDKLSEALFHKGKLLRQKLLGY